MKASIFQNTCFDARVMRIQENHCWLRFWRIRKITENDY